MSAELLDVIPECSALFADEGPGPYSTPVVVYAWWEWQLDFHGGWVLQVGMIADPGPMGQNEEFHPEMRLAYKTPPPGDKELG